MLDGERYLLISLLSTLLPGKKCRSSLFMLNKDDLLRLKKITERERSSVPGRTFALEQAREAHELWKKRRYAWQGWLDFIALFGACIFSIIYIEHPVKMINFMFH